MPLRGVCVAHLPDWREVGKELIALTYSLHAAQGFYRSPLRAGKYAILRAWQTTNA